MLAIDRRNAIANLVNEQGSVTQAELVRLFKVSTETIRKDLLALENEKLLTRTHGGAIRVGKGLMPLRERHKDHVVEKRELCTYALPMIQNGDVIALDEGSTCAELAKLIACTFYNLTIATHSLEIFNILRENPGFELILLGGRFIREEMACAGMLTLSMIEQMHFDKCFLFPSGISLKFGLTDCQEAMTQVQRAYISRSSQVYVLAYSQRFETAESIKLDDVNPAYTYITDAALPTEIYNSYKERNLTVIKE